MNTYLQRFSVAFEYPVHFTRGVFDVENPLLMDTIDRLQENRRHRVQVFIDAGLAAAQPDLARQVTQYIHARQDRIDLVCAPQEVPGGEMAKHSRQAAELIMESIARQHLCRQSFVIAIGGGSTLDIIGLAASLVHRGVRLIRIPTTVLAQNDSAVGVKNGIDAYGVKNFAGTFAPPFGVLVDFDFLDSLPDTYWVGGVAEAFKIAIIKDADLFSYLAAHAPAIRERDKAVMEQVVRRTAIMHLQHIATAGDPFEFGTARPLDFGHWSAHRLEMMSNYAIGHGQAVAIGIALDSYYASRSGRITTTEREAILDAMKTAGLPIWSALLERRTPDGTLEIIQGLHDFQEHLGGELRVTLPVGLGAKEEVNRMESSIIQEAVAYLKERY
ncbi:MAG TPA: 3-dehydroquinate synthase [Verrucomicrobia bacterium]|nr:3-dehydroquinate synthase [Verrucomicrobiota bacterium]